MSGQHSRIVRIQKIKLIFIKAYETKLDIVEESMIPRLCLEFGCTKRKIKEYIQLLIDNDFIIQEDGKFILIDRESINAIDKLKELDVENESQV